MKKIDGRIVKSAFESSGFEMLSPYIDSKTPIGFRCAVGHEHQISWQNFQRGRRCAFCSKKHVLAETVREAFSSEGYTLLSEYEKNRTKMQFLCPDGHEHQISWASFRLGNRCAVCAGLCIKPETVQKAFSSEGYTLLSEYVKNSAPIEFRCPSGHEGRMQWANFRNGKRCRTCSRNYISPTSVQKAFDAAGYTLLSAYENAHDQIRFRCDFGHEHQMSWTSFQGGSRCGVCAVSMHNRLKHGKAYSKICARLRIQSKNLRLSAHWSSFHPQSLIQALATEIEDIYKTCPQSYHVDHLVPVSAFNLFQEVELIACWHPDNLRHYPGVDNLRRNKRMTLVEYDMIKAKNSAILAAASSLILPKGAKKLSCLRQYHLPNPLSRQLSLFDPADAIADNPTISNETKLRIV